MNKTTGFWYNFFDIPGVYNAVRSVLLLGKGKMFAEIRNAVALQDGESVLDVGSGPGELSQLFSGNYSGVDYSENYVAYAKNKYPGKMFFQGNVLDLSLPEKSYDVVLLASFIHHFSDEEVKKIIGNMQRVARKRIVLLEPCPWSGNPLAWFLLKMDRGVNVRSFERQKELVSASLQVQSTHMFQSGLYQLSIIVARP